MFMPALKLGIPFFNVIAIYVDTIINRQIWFCILIWPLESDIRSLNQKTATASAVNKTCI